MTSIKELLETKAKRPERTQHVCLAADLVDRHQILSAELAEALQKERNGGTSPKRVAEKSKSSEIAAAITAVEAEMAEATVEIKLRAVVPTEWRDWRNAHPAREDVVLDEQLGLDSDALIDDMTRRCIVSPVFDDDDWAKWRAEVANAEQLSLALTVYSLHEQRVNVPKSPLASLVTSRSDADSKPQPASE